MASIRPWGSVKRARKSGRNFLDDAFVDVEDLESQVVVLDPGSDIGIAVKLESFAGFPARIEHREIDVGMDGWLAGPAREPRPHVAGGAEGPLFVELGNDRQGVLKAKWLPTSAERS